MDGECDSLAFRGCTLNGKYKVRRPHLFIGTYRYKLANHGSMIWVKTTLPDMAAVARCVDDGDRVRLQLLLDLGLQRLHGGGIRGPRRPGRRRPGSEPPAPGAARRRRRGPGGEPGGGGGGGGEGNGGVTADGPTGGGVGGVGEAAEEHGGEGAGGGGGGPHLLHRRWRGDGTGEIGRAHV